MQSKISNFQTGVSVPESCVFHPYSSGLLVWHRGSHMIATVQSFDYCVVQQRSTVTVP